MSIIISKNGSNARVVNPSGFENEDYLQNYIHENPESIPLYEIAEDRKLFIVKREFQTNSGSITCLIFQLMKIVLVVGVQDKSPLFILKSLGQIKPEGKSLFLTFGVMVTFR